MSKQHFTTKHANAATVQHGWYVVDGTNQTVGRMCARIAAVLRGKNKAYYTPHVDCGDYVIVTNCEKVAFTGNKLDEKLYDTYSGYPGGLKQETAKSLIKRRPEVVVERAVKGMLPKNRLGRKMVKKLFVYAGAEHPHVAQQPKDVKISATGGGFKGQAEAAMLGIARVLVDMNADFRPPLKAAGLLKRDPRSVERKKFGHKKARKSFQFSKR